MSKGTIIAGTILGMLGVVLCFLLPTIIIFSSLLILVPLFDPFYTNIINIFLSVPFWILLSLILYCFIIIIMILYTGILKKRYTITFALLLIIAIIIIPVYFITFYTYFGPEIWLLIFILFGTPLIIGIVLSTISAFLLLFSRGYNSTLNKNIYKSKF